MKKKSFTGGINRQQRAYQKIFFVPRYSRADWINCFSICKNFGLEFATLESPEETRTLQDICRRTANSLIGNPFLSAITYTPGTPNDWYWAQRGDRIKFSIPWARNEPNNAGNNEQCLQLAKIWDCNFNDGPCSGARQECLCERVVFN